MFSRSLLIAALFTLAACADSGSGSKGKTDPKDENQLQTTDLTDRSSCQGATPAGLSIIGNLWTSKSAFEDGLIMENQITFEANSLTMVTLVKEGDTTLDRLQIRPQASVTASTVQILSDESDRATFQRPDGRTLSLSIELGKSTLSYSFQGSCLLLKGEGADQQILLIRGNL